MGSNFKFQSLVIGLPLLSISVSCREPRTPFPLTHNTSTMSPSSSSKVYACSHQCGCDYTSRHAVAVTKHKLKGSDHRNCTPQCPSHYLLARNNIKTKTPQSTSTKQPEHQKLPVTQEPPLPNQSIHRVLEPTKRMRSCEDTDEDPTKPKKSIWESGLLSNSPTPPRQIAPRKTGVVP